MTHKTSSDRPKESKYHNWTYIAETIKRLRAGMDVEDTWFMSLPTASMVRIAKDLGICEPFAITHRSLLYAATAAFQLGLFTHDLTEAEWNELASHSRFTMSHLTPVQFERAVAALFR